MKQRKGFTLIETLIAVAVGSVIIGGGMYLYHSGVKSFYRTTEHASLREESLIVMETIARDMEQIMVTPGQMPDGSYHLVKPFILTGAPSTITKFNPITKVDEPYAKANRGITLWRYHHTETGSDGKPLMVGRKVEYVAEPFSAADPGRGFMLKRNGAPVNHMPLREIAFITEPALVTTDQIGASPNGVVTVFVIPAGDRAALLLKSRDIIETLMKQRALVSRTFHLQGFESFYTAMLNQAMRIVANKGGDPMNPPPGTLTGVYEAVFNDAKGNLVSQGPSGVALFAKVVDRFKTGGAVAYPELEADKIFKVEFEKPYSEAGAFSDGAFTKDSPTPGIDPGPPADLNGGGGGGGEGNGENNE